MERGDIRLVSLAELLDEMREGEFPPSVEDWASWRVDPTNFTLVAGTWSRYYVDLERCLTPPQVLDWIFQVSNKTWGTAEVLAGLVHALDYVLHPQANLCSSGRAASISKRFVRERVRKLARGFPEIVAETED